MQLWADDRRRPCNGNFACECTAWMVIYVALALPHACPFNARVTIDVALALVHAIACNAGVTIDVALALVITLVHAMLAWRLTSPSDRFMLSHAMLG